MIILVLYVDDIILAGNNQEKLQEIKSRLCDAFQMTNMGEPNMYLGMKIQRDRLNKTMTLTQTDYIEKILERFNMKDCKAQNFPMITRQAKRKEIESNSERHKEREIPCIAPYRETIGSLEYLSAMTRPDITYTVNFMARKQAAPTENDWKEVKRIFRLLQKTKEVGLVYRRGGDKLEAFTDSSFRDQTDSTSTGGYIIKLYGNTVAWRSYKQNYVSFSTCQAEYLTMSEACQEIISLDKAIRDMTGKTYFPATI
ncbi:uncharacterized protein LOC131672338 [Phymastichus coffea]|uniref:uncharacterized protein LOC131672338 n=1 Tax=Phymastichus coffea TaxID=108790 RepID=UPI00273CA570|nr:uncharacterized protein LOC131672338 [Phymastichus coffea]